MNDRFLSPFAFYMETLDPRRLRRSYTGRAEFWLGITHFLHIVKALRLNNAKFLFFS